MTESDTTEMPCKIYNTYKDCTLCGMCKSNCPSFIGSTSEKYSPRARSFFQKQGKTYDLSFYNCTLCRACMTECPINVDLELRKIRFQLVEHGIETEANKKMMENVRKYGNPFGNVKKGTAPKELYCC